MTHRLFKHLRYTSLPATGALAALADGCWKIENASAQAQEFTVLPDGFFKVLRQEQPASPPRLLLAGLWTRPRVITIAAHGTVVGVRFKLAVAEYFAQPLPLNAVLPLPPTHWLAPALLAPALPAVARATEELLAGWQSTPAKQALFAALYRGGGWWPVQQVAAVAGWPARQINRYFRQQFGLSLKVYSDILRVYAAARQLRPAGGLFPQGNYCDQSHGIRQLKKYTGHTPRQLDQRRLDRFIQLCPPATPEVCAQ